MKRYALNLKTCRFLLLTGASLLSFVLFAQPAAAQWPTTEWNVLEEDTAYKRNVFGKIEHLVWDETIELMAGRDTEKYKTNMSGYLRQPVAGSNRSGLQRLIYLPWIII